MYYFAENYASLCTIILFLAFLNGVFATCRPPGEFADLSLCTSNSATGRAFYIDTSTVPEYTTADCKCSVNINKVVTNIQVSYNYQGPTSRCENGFQLMLSNISFTCNITTIDVEYVDEILFVKETAGPINYACLIIYVDRTLADEETNATAAINCFESIVHTTSTDSITSTSGDTVSITESEIPHFSGSSVQQSTNYGHESHIYSSPPTTVSSRITSEKETMFPEYVIIAVVAGVGGALVIIVVIVILIACCRQNNTKAVYDVKKKQHNDSVSTDSELTENAFYNLALVSNPSYY